MVENSVVIENVLEQPIEGQKKESAKKGTHARNRLTALIGALILIFSANRFCYNNSFGKQLDYFNS